MLGCRVLSLRAREGDLDVCVCVFHAVHFPRCRPVQQPREGYIQPGLPSLEQLQAGGAVYRLKEDQNEYARAERRRRKREKEKRFVAVVGVGLSLTTIHPLFLCVSGRGETRKVEEAKEQFAWGRGKVQKEEEKQWKEELENIAAEPFARTVDDTRLEDARKAEIRADDPMAAYMAKVHTVSCARDGSDVYVVWACVSLVALSRWGRTLLFLVAAGAVARTYFALVL